MKNNKKAFIHKLFESQVEQKPTATAVVFNNKEISYSELNQQANLIAHDLLRIKLYAQKKVAVFLERSPDAVAAMIGVLKTGNHYIPLDPEHPVERINLILSEANPDIVITQKKFANQILGDHKLLFIDDEESSKKNLYDNPDFDIESENLAYIIFTSGSTGRPKGVMIPHRAVNNFMRSMKNCPGMTPEDKLLAVTTVSFDISALELFLPLTIGATIILLDQEAVRDPFLIIRTLEEQQCTIMQATPATWQMMIDAGWQGKRNFRILCGGEALSYELAETLLKKCDELWNMYGPTETTIWSTVERVLPEKKISIGKPIYNTTIYILDENLIQVNHGTEGDLYIGGEGLALGYYNRSDLTEKAFIKNPYNTTEKIYKTGDIARFMEDGRLECLGRKDFQVKIRGFRIELGDIESALMKMPDIKNAIVHTQNVIGTGKSLVAYLICDSGEIEHSQIRDFLSEYLPDYMIPEYSIFVKHFPINPNGKIDRKVLPIPKSSAMNDNQEINIQDMSNEEKILWSWKSVLQLKDVDPNVNFFDLGGNSILSVQLITKINKLCSTRIPLGTFFKNATINKMITIIKDENESDNDTVIELQGKGDGMPLFCLGGIHLYNDLAEALGEVRPVYGVFLPYEQQLIEHIQNNTLSEWKYFTIRGMAEAYLKDIRKVQPKGPYNLLGISIAGFISFEIARLLTAEGEKINSLFILDSHIPSVSKKGIYFYSYLLIKNIFRLISGKKVTIKNEANADGLSPSEVAAKRDQVNDGAIRIFDQEKPFYNGNICLIKASETEYAKGENYPDDLGWAELVGGKLSIFKFQGSHIGILKKPNVQYVADKINSYIKKN